MTGLRHRLGARIQNVRPVEISPANAERLWCSYQSAYIDDKALLASVHACQPINGMTEFSTVNTFIHYLSMPETIAFEIPDPNKPSAPPLSFAIARYSSTNRASKKAFCDYYLSEPFDGERLMYTDDDARTELELAFDAGNMLYLVEFVSRGGRLATTALLMRVFSYVCHNLLHVEDCQVIGKCLDAATHGECHNAIGNRDIKQMTASFELRKLARQAQVRQVTGSTLPVLLHFGLFLGTSQYLSTFYRSIQQGSEECETPRQAALPAPEATIQKLPNRQYP